jgi:hypothetical protein
VRINNNDDDDGENSLVATSDGRPSQLCAGCATTIADGVLTHLLHGRTLLFHLGCALDAVFARLSCPICAATRERDELARGHCSPFVSMSVADMLEEAIMCDNRWDGRRKPGRSGRRDNAANRAWFVTLPRGSDSCQDETSRRRPDGSTVRGT